jgi:hypothetical protein
VTKFDLAQPRRLLELAPQAVRAVTALGAFTLRNAADLAGFARDLTAGRLPSRLPPHRVLLRMEIERTIVVDGTAVVAVTGDWASGRTSSNNSASAEPGPEAGGVDCVVGVAHEGRVVALPGRCDVSASAVAVPANVVSVVGLPSDVPLEGCVVVDAYNLPGPAAKSGTLLRGQATITDAGGEWRQVQMSAERETTWEGVTTSTRKVAGD